MTTEIRAHDWGILGDERIPRWPSAIGEKRRIEVTISSWVGLSIGAKHHEVTVDEQQNSWWCEDRNAWVELSCDAQSGGWKLRASVIGQGAAIKLALYFVQQIAGNKRPNHEVVWSGPGRPHWAS